MYLRFIYLLLLIFAFIRFPVFANDFGISAIVNDVVITRRDVSNRVDLLFFDSGLSRNVENEERLFRLARLQLIDDSLKLGAAGSLGVLASRDAVDLAISDLAASNNVSVSSLGDIFLRAGVDSDHFWRQQYVRVSWGNVLLREFDRLGGISENEISTYIDSVRAREGDEEVRLREIFLPYGSSLSVSRARSLGLEILSRLSSGADFGPLARGFSASHSARLGGDSGWVPINFLDDDVAMIVSSLRLGEVSGLIENLSGITIVKLESRRLLGAAEVAAATDRERVISILRGRKLELLNRQLLLRLKGDAFIELR